MRARQITQRQGGFGLVEIMIALVLGLLLIGAAGQVFLSNSATYRFNEALATVQDSGRFALHTIEHDLRLAGYTGCSTVPTSTAASTVQDMRPVGRVQVVDTEANDAAADERAYLDNVIGEATTGDVLPGRAVAASNSDALRLAYMRDYGVRVAVPAAANSDPLEVSGDVGNFGDGALLLVTDCREADMFRMTGTGTSGSNVTVAHARNNGDGEAVNASAALSKIYSRDARVLNPYAAAYYVGDTSRDDDAGNNILALYRREVLPTLIGSVEVVPGISHLTLRYGVDANGDQAPDGYANAAGVADWNDVVSVRVGFLAKSDRRAGAEKPDSLQIFDRAIDMDSIPDDGHVRRVFTTTVALRNRVR